jgi:hypothetical protein
LKYQSGELQVNLMEVPSSIWLVGSGCTKMDLVELEGWLSGLQ